MEDSILFISEKLLGKGSQYLYLQKFNRIVSEYDQGPLRIELKFLLWLLRKRCARTFTSHPNGCSWNFSWLPSKQSE